MTPLELKNYFREQLIRQRAISQEFNVLDAIVDFITQATTDGIPDWTALLTFNTDGTGSGKYSLWPDANANLRFWETKTDGNINHQPPTDPDIHEDAFWKEVSPSSGSAIKEWTPGIFGDGLVIVYFDLNGDDTGMDLFKLVEPARPFNSTDFFTELAAGSWVKLGGPIKSIVNTAADPIVLDSRHGKEVIFEGNNAIGGAKTIQFDNEGGAMKMIFLFEMSAVATLTFPDNVKMATFLEFGGQQWTPESAGEFEAELTRKGANWLMKINGPF